MKNCDCLERFAFGFLRACLAVVLVATALLTLTTEARVMRLEQRAASQDECPSGVDCQIQAHRGASITWVEIP